MHHDVERFINQTDELKIAYDSYISWELNGGKEQLLGANRLTTHQLFWLALARARYVKGKVLAAQPERNNYKKTLFWYNFCLYDLNSFKTIREDFHCKKKGDYATTNPCETSVPLLAPYANFHLIKFKHWLQEVGLNFA